MTNRPITRNDLIAVSLIWMLVAVGAMRRPDAAPERADVSCSHRPAAG